MASTSCTKFLKNFSKFLEEYNKELKEKLAINLDVESSKIDEVMSTLSTKIETGKSGGAQKKKREPTLYNKFMQVKIKELREQNSDVDKTDLMKMAAKAWQEEKKKNAEK
jgi:hypothetical protein